MTTILLLLGLGLTLAAPGTTQAADAATGAREVRRFDQDWRFHLGEVPEAQAPGFDDHAWRPLDLPHDWSIELPFEARWASGTGYLPGGIGWYRKTFRLPSAAPRQRVSVRFDGVYKNSEVWINSHSLGKRPNGYVSFEYDLTPHLLAGQPNVLAVRVDHSDYADSRWYPGSGIYRHVWLRVTGDVHAAPWGTFVRTPEITAQSATVAIANRIRNDGPQSREVTLRSVIEDASGKPLASVESSRPIGAGEEVNFEQTVRLAEPWWWSPETPVLHTLVNRLVVSNAVVDEWRTPFGIRTIRFDPDHGFFLNGAKTLVKGVCLHHDAGCLGAAVPDDALARRLRLLKEVGCNAIRTSHNPPAPELLDLCDRMGFLVMDEAFDEWARPKKKWVEGVNVGQPSFEGYARDFAEWGIRDLESMVERDKNHPCVILWSIGNEIDFRQDPYFDPASPDYQPGQPSAAELPGIATNLIRAVKAIDSSRPVTAALANLAVSNPTGLAGLLDVVGYNYQESLYAADHARYPDRKLIGSENGHAFSAWQTVEDLPYANGQFLWTGFDYLGESRGWPVRSSGAGLLDECGFKKPAFYFRQSLWSDKPMVYLAVRPPGASPGGFGRRGAPAAANWTWPGKESGRMTVLGYANCDEVELFLNGKSLGSKPASAAQDGVRSWEVPYAAGTLRAEGRRNGATACAFELRTAGPAARLVLSADKTALAADGRSLAYVEVSVTDREGNLVYPADDLVQFNLAGPGRILAVDSGDARSHESFQASSRKAYQGRCLVIVQSTATPGTLRLTAAAAGLEPAEVRITTAPESPSTAAAGRPTLFLIGDSTVNNSTRGLQGWGTPIADLFDRSRLAVENRARGGRSSRTFLTEGLWNAVAAALKPGDFVLMQFGHNDGGSLNQGRARASLKGNGDESQEVVMEATGKKETVHTYGWYLRKFIADAKAKGASPIVLSPIPRNMWKDGRVLRAANDYGKWAAEAAQAGGTFFIDLNDLVARHYEVAGQTAVQERFFTAADHTHTTPAGARLNAASVTEGIRGLRDCALSGYLLPTAPISGGSRP